MSINEENKTEQQDALNEEKLEQVTGGDIKLRLPVTYLRRPTESRRPDREKLGFRRPDQEVRSGRRPDYRRPMRPDDPEAR